VRRILSIDGGGVRGVLPASFLATVEEQIDENVVDYFDLIVGTSTGGIIAVALGAGIAAADIRDFYLERGPRIFPSNGRLLRKARGLASARYDEKQLQAELEEVLGDRRIGESKTRLVIPSMDVTSGKVHLWKTAHNVRFVQDYQLRMVDAAMATAAAPTYFRPFLTDAGTPLVDGGVFANNPAGLAAVEAVGVLGWPRDEIALLSLGCGAEALDVRIRGWWRSGLLGFAPKVVDVFMAAQSDASCGSAIHLLGDRDKFFRISPTLPAKRYGLDIVSELPTLSGLGNTIARHELQNIRTTFFTERAEAFVPDLSL
jgi:patatin-like phospholipase/acyl hydrolase